MESGITSKLARDKTTSMEYRSVEYFVLKGLFDTRFYQKNWVVT